MKTLPSILIVADRGHLIAYRSTETGSLRKIESAAFAEGNQKISEIFTDQAGAFGYSGTPGTGSAERMGLIAELEMRCFRQIAEKIAAIIDLENPGQWGFAASSEINGAILDGMDEKYHRKLAINLRSNLTNSPVSEVSDHFKKVKGKSRTQRLVRSVGNMSRYNAILIENLLQNKGHALVKPGE